MTIRTPFMALCLALAMPAAHAIVSTSAPANWLGSTDARLDGAGMLVMGSTLCSASLLAGGAFAITAAHCVSGGAPNVSVSSGQLSFKGGAVTASFSSAAQVSVFPTWAGTGTTGQGLGFNNDLALIALDHPVTQVAGYPVRAIDPMGATVLIAGYGYSGVGSTGYQVGTAGTLHWGMNIYDSLMSGAGSSYLFDFDSGLAANNLMGGLGLGSLEGTIAPGDSGGSTFVDVSGVLWLAGVHSFIGRNDTGTTDVDTALNASYGEFAGDTALYTSANLAWISSVTAVPEPATGGLLLPGLALIGLAARRGRREGSA